MATTQGTCDERGRHCQVIDLKGFPNEQGAEHRTQRLFRNRKGLGSDVRWVGTGPLAGFWHLRT